MPQSPLFSDVRLVLFDLDGTLIDSAPDLAAAANEMLVHRGLPALGFERLRPMVGAGARGMVGVAFGVKPGEADYEALKQEFLARYERCMLDQTQCFAEVLPMLSALEQAELGWGIVTNKAERLAVPIATALDLAPRCRALVGGDTTPHTKPHPAPLLEAARRAGVAPAHCLYVGDDERDIIAGRAAGMRTVAAAWGYLGQGAAVQAWGANIVIDSPLQLLNCLGLP
jgi:2-phosphoglycolate phosphatase